VSSIVTREKEKQKSVYLRTMEQIEKKERRGKTSDPRSIDRDKHLVDTRCHTRRRVTPCPRRASCVFFIDGVYYIVSWQQQACMLLHPLEFSFVLFAGFRVTDISVYKRCLLLWDWLKLSWAGSFDVTGKGSEGVYR
jgi:hypothetical protein